MTLGLDASTSVCGWAFSENGEVKDAGFLDISKLPTNKEKAYGIIDLLNRNINMKVVSSINLESPLFGFVGGSTTQQTIIKLVRFNAILEYILAEKYSVPVNLLNVSSMRKKVLGRSRIQGMKSKEFVKIYLPKIIPYIKNFHVINKIGNVDKRCEDMYDAVIASLS